MLGSLLGIVIAAVGRIAIESQFKLLSMEFNLEIFVGSTLLGIAVGTVGALYPAILASNQNPLKSLVYE